MSMNPEFLEEFWGVGGGVQVGPGGGGSIEHVGDFSVEDGPRIEIDPLPAGYDRFVIFLEFTNLAETAGTPLAQIGTAANSNPNTDVGINTHSVTVSDIPARSHIGTTQTTNRFFLTANDANAQLDSGGLWQGVLNVDFPGDATRGPRFSLRGGYAPAVGNYAASHGSAIYDDANRVTILHIEITPSTNLTGTARVFGYPSAS